MQVPFTTRRLTWLVAVSIAASKRSATVPNVCLITFARWPRCGA